MMADYQRTVDEVLAALGGDSTRGLNDSEARARLERYGRNELTAEPPIPAWRKFLAQFQDVLVILLLVATAISRGAVVYERDAALPYEAIAILAVVLLNAMMGYVQESRAEAAVAALRAMAAAHAHVDSRRRATTRAGRRDRARRHHADRGGRHDAGRRARDRVDGAADRRSGADRREPAGLEGRRGDRRAMSGSATAPTWCSAGRPRPTAAAGRS